MDSNVNVYHLRHESVKLVWNTIRIRNFLGPFDHSSNSTFRAYKVSKAHRGVSLFSIADTCEGRGSVTGSEVLVISWNWAFLGNRQVCIGKITINSFLTIRLSGVTHFGSGFEVECERDKKYFFLTIGQCVPNNWGSFQRLGRYSLRVSCCLTR